jgi:plasmid stabilization system protein ParE
MAEIRWTDEAVRWLHDIYDYISNDSSIPAQKVVTGIYDRINRGPISSNETASLHIIPGGFEFASIVFV